MPKAEVIVPNHLFGHIGVHLLSIFFFRSFRIEADGLVMPPS